MSAALGFPGAPAANPPGSWASRLTVTRELRRAINARGLTLAATAKLAGLSPSNVALIARGGAVPRHATVVRLSEALDWPVLAETSLMTRLRACEVCDAVTVNLGSGNTRRYCSQDCISTAKARQKTGDATRPTAAVALHRLALHQDAVLAFCQSCEPSGTCRTRSCPLRPVSPLPLVEVPLRVVVPS